MENQTKKCTKCNEVKPLDAFNKHSKNKDGYRSYCRECQNNYDHQYRKDNADRLAEYNATPKRRADQALHRAQSKRRQVESKLGITIADDLQSYHIAMIQSSDDECIYCRKELDPSTVTIDHVITFAQGGTNEYKNLLPCCGGCNASKGNRPIMEFLADKCDEYSTKQVIFRLAQRRGIEYDEMYELLNTPELTDE
ncbi:HNH endonuclease [Virgibacillus necropolis]|uniref:HNH nuclease domain-containing protein n=1 Tax=Virgibacillus necropolis TaxID=163877 RepID=A0A221MGT0_9BACI|nr:hypothetical protein CFK40_18370 [Virgibacillus necropolis]